MNRNSVNGWDGDELSETARSACDAVLGVNLALMRVPTRAVFAERMPPPAHTIQALIDRNEVAFAHRERLF